MWSPTWFCDDFVTMLGSSLETNIVEDSIWKTMWILSACLGFPMDFGCPGMGHTATSICNVVFGHIGTLSGGQSAANVGFVIQ